MVIVARKSRLFHSFIISAYSACIDNEQTELKSFKIMRDVCVLHRWCPVIWRASCIKIVLWCVLLESIVDRFHNVSSHSIEYPEQISKHFQLVANRCRKSNKSFHSSIQMRRTFVSQLRSHPAQIAVAAPIVYIVYSIHNVNFTLCYRIWLSW